MVALREAVGNAEKRRFPRIELKKSVCCYAKGKMLQAVAEDLSPGGLFLSLNPLEDRIPLDTLVSLLFREHDGDEVVTFLFARVVRHQNLPVNGIGLRWEKAVSSGTPAQLARFLKSLLKLNEHQLKWVRPDPSGGKKTLFDFQSVHGATRRTLVTPPARETRRCIPKLVRPAPSEADGNRPCNLKGILYVGEKSFPMRVTRLGKDGMVVETAYDPEGHTPPCTARIESPSPDQKSMSVTCRIAGRRLSDTGPHLLELSFTVKAGARNIGRGGAAINGQLGRYMKWLNVR